jgi:hypothetical protein
MTISSLTLREGGFWKMRITKDPYRLCFLLLVILVLSAAIPATAEIQRNPSVFQELHHDTSLPLTSYPVIYMPRYKHEVKNSMRPRPFPPSGLPDGVGAQTETLVPELSAIIGLNFDGQNADGFAPPDTNGAVGQTQFLQMVNVVWNVYDKATGNKQGGPFPGNQFWAASAAHVRPRTTATPSSSTTRPQDAGWRYNRYSARHL